MTATVLTAHTHLHTYRDQGRHSLPQRQRSPQRSSHPAPHHARAPGTPRRRARLWSPHYPGLSCPWPLPPAGYLPARPSPEDGRLAGRQLGCQRHPKHRQPAACKVGTQIERQRAATTELVVALLHPRVRRKRGTIIIFTIILIITITTITPTSTSTSTPTTSSLFAAADHSSPLLTGPHRPTRRQPRRTCLDVLCKFVRLPHPHPPEFHSIHSNPRAASRAFGRSVSLPYSYSFAHKEQGPRLAYVLPLTLNGTA